MLTLTLSVASGPSAVAFISYSSLGSIINATFFDEMNEKDQVHLNSQIVSAAIGPQKNTSLSSSVILSFQHVKVGQTCHLSLLGFHAGRPICRASALPRVRARSCLQLFSTQSKGAPLKTGTSFGACITQAVPPHPEMNSWLVTETTCVYQSLGGGRGVGQVQGGEEGSIQ